MSKMEQEVIEQSKLLEDTMPGLLSLEALKGQFVAFWKGSMIIAKTHEECYDLAVSAFGCSGFALGEITSEKPFISCLTLSLMI